MQTVVVNQLINLMQTVVVSGFLIMGYLMQAVDFSSWGICCDVVSVVMWYLMPAVVVSHHSPLSSVVLYVQRHWVSMVMIGVLLSLSTPPQPLASLTPDLLLCITEGVCLFVLKKKKHSKSLQKKYEQICFVLL